MRDNSETKDVDSGVKSAAAGETSNAERVPPSKGWTNRTGIIVVIALFLIAAVAVVGWIVLRSRSSGAGRPVPAPRSMPEEQSSSPNAAESTVTVTPEVMQRAGIKVEPIGEQVSPDLASSALTTGIV